MNWREVHTPSVPDVSIIFLACNQATWIAETLRNVLAQTHTSWERIVVNDGSTDETAALGQELVSQDARFLLLNEPNSSVSCARIHGLDADRGDFVLFRDGDDLLLPYKLTHQLEVTDRTGAEVHLSSIRVDWLCDRTSPTHGQLWSPPACIKESLLEFLSKWEIEYIFPIHAFLTRRVPLLRAAARWNSSLYSHEDWVFWFQAMAAGLRVSTSNEVTAIFRVHAREVPANRYCARKGYLQSFAVQQERYVSTPNIASMLDLQFRQIHRVCAAALRSDVG